MITLPPEFEADIQGQDLNLYPVVTIETLVLDPSLTTDSEADVSVYMWETFTTFTHDGALDTFNIGDYVKIDDEYMIVTNIVLSNVYVTRGLLGSEITPHDVGADIYIIHLYELNISTKNVTLSNVHYKPLLLNIPSIKESMDFENRNYKISSVTLKISNYEYKGERFSDGVDSVGSPLNLINSSVSIQWVSQSESTLPVYNGFVRRYSHDDETVTLKLEDSTQKDLHADVPKARLEDTDDVPDKYKLKPIPMVYGYVDFSPCVISGKYDAEQEELVTLDTIYCDSKPLSTLSIEANSIFLGNHEVKQSLLYAQTDDSSYVNCSIGTSSGGGDNFDGSPLGTTGQITINTSDNENDSGQDRIYGKVIRGLFNPSALKHSGEYTAWWGDPTNSENLIDYVSSSRISAQTSDGEFDTFIWWDNRHHNYDQYLNAKIHLKEFFMPNHIEFSTWLITKWECTNFSTSSGSIQLAIWTGDAVPIWNPVTVDFWRGTGLALHAFDIPFGNPTVTYNNFDGNDAFLSIHLDEIFDYFNVKSVNLGIPTHFVHDNSDPVTGAYFNLHIHEMHIYHTLHLYDLLNVNFYIKINGRTLAGYES